MLMYRLRYWDAVARSFSRNCGYGPVFSIEEQAEIYNDSIHDYFSTNAYKFYA